MTDIVYGENYLSNLELEKIWFELDFISKALVQPEYCGAETGKKNGLGFFAEEYIAQTMMPSIFSIKNKVDHIGRTTVLVNYYTDGGFYLPHHDDSKKTLTVFLAKDEKSFTGGEFRFVDYNITLPFKNNSFVIFPGYIEHEVTPVKMIGNTGRYSLNYFFY